MTRPQIQEQWAAFCSDPGEDNFASLYNGTRNFVFTICRRVLRDEEESLDVLQSVYSELLMIAQSGKPGIAEIDVNELVKRLALRLADTRRKQFTRQNRRFVSVDDVNALPVVSEQTSSRDQVANAQIRSMVAVAVEEVPEQLRIPLMMYYEQDMTHQQIADSLGVSRGYITRQINSGAEILEGILRRQGITQPLSVVIGVLGGAAAFAPPSQATAAAVWTSGKAATASSVSSSASADLLKSPSGQQSSGGQPSQFPGASGVRMLKSKLGLTIGAAVFVLIVLAAFDRHQKTSLANRDADLSPSVSPVAALRVRNESQVTRATPASPSLPSIDESLGLGAIRGRLVSKYDSSPIANQVIDIVELQTSSTEPSLLLKSTAVSSPDGRFTFPRIPAGDYTVRTNDEGNWASSIRQIHVMAGEFTDLNDVSLNGLGVIDGQILQELDLQPVPGQSISTWDPINKKMQLLKTGSDGRFLIKGLENWGYLFYINGFDYCRGINLENNQRRSVKILLGSATVEGSVKRTGPDNLVGITLSRVVDTDFEVFSRTLRKPGRFEVTSVPKGIYLATARVKTKGFAKQSAHKFISVDDTEPLVLDFTLPSGVIKGSLPAAVKGQPITICAEEISGFSHDSIPGDVKTSASADGTFVLEGCSPGDYTVWAVLPGGVLAVANPVTVPFEGESKWTELQVLPEAEAASMSVTVLGFDDGRPVASAWCDLVGPRGRICITDRPTTAGRLTLKGLTPGHYTMHVSAFGQTVSNREFDVAAGQEFSAEEVLDGAGGLSWTLGRVAGKPVPGGKCTLTPLDKNTRAVPRTGTVDDQGQWIIRGILPGQYELSVDYGDTTHSHRVFVDAHINVLQHTQIP